MEKGIMLLLCALALAAAAGGWNCKQEVRTLKARLAGLEGRLGKMKRESLLWQERLETAEKQLEKSEALLEAREEAAREAAKSERLFQEGLSNILYYDARRRGSDGTNG